MRISESELKFRALKGGSGLTSSATLSSSPRLLSLHLSLPLSHTHIYTHTYSSRGKETRLSESGPRPGSGGPQWQRGSRTVAGGAVPPAPPGSPPAAVWLLPSAGPAVPSQEASLLPGSRSPVSLPLGGSACPSQAAGVGSAAPCRLPSGARGSTQPRGYLKCTCIPTFLTPLSRAHGLFTYCLIYSLCLFFIVHSPARTPAPPGQRPQNNSRTSQVPSGDFLVDK